MPNLGLKRLLRKKKLAYKVVLDITMALSGKLAVFDEHGSVLVGQESKSMGSGRTAVSMDGKIAGWVSGPKDRRIVTAQLLENMLATEAEKRELSEEVLNNYRELNLLYNLSERLIAAPEPPAIANLALGEADRLVGATAAWVFLFDNDSRIVPIAKRGRPLAFKHSPSSDNDLIRAVLATAEAEIRNKVPLHMLFHGVGNDKGDLICAPLKTEQRLLGVMLLVGVKPVHYQAHHLKLLNTVALQVGPALEIARLYQVAVEKGRMEQELRQAYEVQASLIPRQTPAIDGWAFAGRWRPARELSGDYYDFIPLRDGGLGLVIGDVADKGMPSSLFMVFTRSAVRSAVAHLASPSAAIDQANDLVAQESQHGLFVTLLYGRLDPASGRLVYVNAGHNPALHIESTSGKVGELRNTGIPLGIMQGVTYREAEVQLLPGDFLIFYTDGVTEAMNSDYEEFTVSRLMDVIKKHKGKSAEEMAEGIEAAVLEFTGDRSLFDDLTLLIIERKQ